MTAKSTEHILLGKAEKDVYIERSSHGWLLNADGAQLVRSRRIQGALNELKVDYDYISPNMTLYDSTPKQRLEKMLTLLLSPSIKRKRITRKPAAFSLFMYNMN